MPGDVWAAGIEHREADEGLQTAASRVAAIAAAMDRVVDEAETGWGSTGTYVVHVYSGCEWHERCTDEGLWGDCEYCAHLEPEFDFTLIGWAKATRVKAEVYAQGEDEDGPCDFTWREVTEPANAQEAP